MSDKWIQKAVSGMKKKGTIGSFGKATPKKIAAAKKEGGIEKKRAVFAENMVHISKSNRGTHYTQGGVPGDRSEHYQSGNAVEAREKMIGKC